MKPASTFRFLAIFAYAASSAAPGFAQSAAQNSYDTASFADKFCRMQVLNSNLPDPRQVYANCMARQAPAAGSPAPAGPANTSSGEIDTILQRADQAADVAYSGRDTFPGSDHRVNPWQQGNSERQALALYYQAGEMGDRRGAVGHCKMEAWSYARQGISNPIPGGINGCVNNLVAAWQAKRQEHQLARATPAHAVPTGIFKVACIPVSWDGVDWKGRNIPPTVADAYSITIDPGRKTVTMSFDPFHSGSAGALTDLLTDMARADATAHTRRPRLFQDGREGAYEGVGSSGEGYHEAVEFGPGGVNFYQQNYHFGNPTIRSGGTYNYADQSLELFGELYNSKAQCAYNPESALRGVLARLGAGS